MSDDNQTETTAPEQQLVKADADRSKRRAKQGKLLKWRKTRGEPMWFTPDLVPHGYRVEIDGPVAHCSGPGDWTHDVDWLMGETDKQHLGRAQAACEEHAQEHAQQQASDTERDTKPENSPGELGDWSIPVPLTEGEVLLKGRELADITLQLGKEQLKIARANEARKNAINAANASIEELSERAVPLARALDDLAENRLVKCRKRKDDVGKVITYHDAETDELLHTHEPSKFEQQQLWGGTEPPADKPPEDGPNKLRLAKGDGGPLIGTVVVAGSLPGVLVWPSTEGVMEIVSECGRYRICKTKHSALTTSIYLPYCGNRQLTDAPRSVGSWEAAQASCQAHLNAQEWEPAEPKWVEQPNSPGWWYLQGTDYQVQREGERFIALYRDRRIPDKTTSLLDDELAKVACETHRDQHTLRWQQLVEGQPDQLISTCGSYRVRLEASDDIKTTAWIALFGKPGKGGAKRGAKRGEVQLHDPGGLIEWATPEEAKEVCQSHHLAEPEERKRYEPDPRVPKGPKRSRK